MDWETWEILIDEAMIKQIKESEEDIKYGRVERVTIEQLKKLIY